MAGTTSTSSGWSVLHIRGCCQSLARTCVYAALVNVIYLHHLLLSFIQIRLVYMVNNPKEMQAITNKSQIIARDAKQLQTNANLPQMH